MAEMISMCGLVCTTCPAYLAIQENDDAKRKATAESWSKQFNSKIKPEDVNCDGCLNSKGTCFQYCTVCEIRKCGTGRGVKNCAFCPEFGCAKLSAFFDNVPEAKKRLEAVRSRSRRK